jgi:quaternary ammonium compound-resistance protein SugE
VSWIVLCAAGLLEVAWASALPATEGLRRPLPTLVFLVALAGSMYGLAKASETIPLGTAYAVWIGIGAVGIAVIGMLRGDPVTLVRVLCLVLIVAGVVGLNLSGEH